MIRKGTKAELFYINTQKKDPKAVNPLKIKHNVMSGYNYLALSWCKGEHESLFSFLFTIVYCLVFYSALACVPVREDITNYLTHTVEAGQQYGAPSTRACFP